MTVVSVADGRVTYGYRLSAADDDVEMADAAGCDDDDMQSYDITAPIAAAAAIVAAAPAAVVAAAPAGIHVHQSSHLQL